MPAFTRGARWPATRVSPPAWRRSMRCSLTTSRCSAATPPSPASTLAATPPAFPPPRRARRPRSAHERGRALHWPREVEQSALEACARALQGTHDFTAFTPTETDHVRFERDVLAAFWRRRSADVLEFWIEADSFMRHMNRVLVGTMLEVAGGRRSLEEFVALLGGRPRAHAGQTAPAHGLYLAGVGYRSQPVLDVPH